MFLLFWPLHRVDREDSIWTGLGVLEDSIAKVSFSLLERIEKTVDIRWKFFCHRIARQRRALWGVLSIERNHIKTFQLFSRWRSYIRRERLWAERSPIRTIKFFFAHLVIKKRGLIEFN